MKKLLLVSVSALFAAAPMLAHANPTAYDGETPASVTASASAPYATLATNAEGDTTNVVTASYVKGAYNDAIMAINKEQSDRVNTDKVTKHSVNDTAQALHYLTENNGNVGANLGRLDYEIGLINTTAGNAATKDLNNLTTTGKANVAAQGTFDNSTNYTDGTVGAQIKTNKADIAKLNGDATTTGSVAKSIADAFAASDGNGLTESGGVLSVATTTNGGLELTGTEGSQTLGVKVDGVSVGKDASGNVNVQVDGTTLVKDTTNNYVKVGSALTTSNFGSGVIVTEVGGTGSDTALPTEQAVREAITAATSGADMVTLNEAQTLTNKTIDTADGNTIRNLGTGNVAAGSLVNSTEEILNQTDASDTEFVTEKAVAKAIDTSTVTVKAYTTWNTTTQGDVATTSVIFNPGTKQRTTQGTAATHGA